MTASQLQTIEEVITIKGINPNPFVRQGKTVSIGGLLLADGQTWVNVAEGLTMSSFQKGGTYKVKRQVLENGNKGNIIEVLGLDETESNPTSASAAGDFRGFKFNNTGQSQKLGGLFHDAAQLAGALVVANGMNTADALKTFDQVINHIVDTRKKFD